MHPQNLPELATVSVIHRRYFQGRSERYVRELARRGAFGSEAVREPKGWLIPLTGVAEYVRLHTVKLDRDKGCFVDPFAATNRRTANLVQFRR